MEKRNYVKPETGRHEFSMNPFMVGSQIVADTPEEVVKLIENLDGCFMIHGTVSDQTLADRIGEGNSVCVETAKPERGESCDPTSGFTTTGKRYTLTYKGKREYNDKIVNVFTLDGPYDSCQVSTKLN